MGANSDDPDGPAAGKKPKAKKDEPAVDDDGFAEVVEKRPKKGKVAEPVSDDDGFSEVTEKRPKK